MTIAIFVTIWTTGMSTGALDTHFRSAPLNYLKGENTVHSVEIYTPEVGEVPMLEDAPSPTIIIQIDMNDAAAAQALTKSEQFQKIFMDKK